MPVDLSNKGSLTKNSSIVAKTMANVIVMSENKKSLYVVDSYDYNDFKLSHDNVWTDESGSVLYSFQHLNRLNSNELEILKTLIRTNQYIFDNKLYIMDSCDYEVETIDIKFNSLDTMINKAKFILNYKTDKDVLKLLLLYLNSTNYSFLSKDMISFLFENFDMLNTNSYTKNLESCLSPLKDYIMTGFLVENDKNFQNFYNVIDWMNDYDVNRSIKEVKSKKNFLNFNHDSFVHNPNHHIIISIFNAYDVYITDSKDAETLFNKDEIEYFKNIQQIYRNMDKVSALEFYMFYAFVDHLASKNGYFEPAEDIKANRTLPNFINRWGKYTTKLDSKLFYNTIGKSQYIDSGHYFEYSFLFALLDNDEHATYEVLGYILGLNKGKILYNEEFYNNVIEWKDANAKIPWRMFANLNDLKNVLNY